MTGAGRGGAPPLRRAAARGWTRAGRRTGAAWLAAPLALLLAAGCGVRAQERPDRLDPSVVPSERGLVRPVVAAVWFVRDGRVVPVRRLLAAPASPRQRLAALVAGADDPALRTYVDPADPPRLDLAAGVAEVTMPAAFATAPRDVRLLAAAQVVFTLTEGDDVAVVRFRAGGRPVSVPRPDGTPTTAPVTRADFAGISA